MAHINIIDYQSAQGRLKEIYDGLISSRGKLAEVHKIQSLNPESIIHHMDLYMGIMYGSSPLKRAEREMIGVVVSSANGCIYCTLHHQAALKAYWKDMDRVKGLAENFKTLKQLSNRELALCELANNLTQQPSLFEGIDKLKPLRDVGFDDRAILDATLVISYFNFVNRIVLSLGVELENDGGTGYKY